jgi:hypothetical protein
LCSLAALNSNSQTLRSDAKLGGQKKYVAYRAKEAYGPNITGVRSMGFGGREAGSALAFVRGAAMPSATHFRLQAAAQTALPKRLSTLSRETAYKVWQRTT